MGENNKNNMFGETDKKSVFETTAKHIRKHYIKTYNNPYMFMHFPIWSSALLYFVIFVNRFPPLGRVPGWWNVYSLR